MPAGGGDVFAVHVGWDQYVFVGSDQPCTDGVARTRELGLFAERLPASSYAAEPEVTEAADEGFWASVRTELAARQGLLWKRPSSPTPHAGTVSPRKTSTQCAPVLARAPC
ncbi:hypothetical protein GCM10022207_89020 [Streptomyces lannensis]|uniref:Uncharacterized protein n=1 Tax=Streptomyces lannensis TaxID=766498 RepID=A0ABP7LTF7_9ACTN